MSETSRKYSDTISEYLTADEIHVLLDCAPHTRARLVMLTQWRSGLRIGEALNLEARDLSLEPPAGEDPVIRVRQGKGNRDRVVPCHPELAVALRLMLDYSPMRQDQRLFDITARTALRWVGSAYSLAVERRQLAPGREIGTHTLRHSYARHLLAHGIQVNVLQKWLGHKNLDTTLRYLELLPDPAGMMATVP